MGIKRVLLALPALIVVACATSESPQKQDAIADFIAVAELQQVSKVRTEGQYSFLRVNEYYIILKTPRGHYLGQMRKRCPSLMKRSSLDEQGSILLRSNVDIRSNPKIFYAGQDTILGCVVDKLYLLDERLVEELKEIPTT